MSNEIFQLIGISTLVFAGSIVLGYVVGLLRNGRRVPAPAVGVQLRLKSPSGVYRARLLRAEKGGWWLSSPLQRNAYVPLRVGESLVVEAPSSVGAMVFHTEVLERDATTHQFRVRPPREVREVERRLEYRHKSFLGRPFKANGEPAELVDLSASGARFLTLAAAAKGDDLRLELPEPFGTVVGWVLETEPASLGSRTGSLVRVRLATPLEGLPKPTAPGSP